MGRRFREGSDASNGAQRALSVRFLGLVVPKSVSWRRASGRARTLRLKSRVANTTAASGIIRRIARGLKINLLQANLQDFMNACERRRRREAVSVQMELGVDFSRVLTYIRQAVSARSVLGATTRIARCRIQKGHDEQWVVVA